MKSKAFKYKGITGEGGSTCSYTNRLPMAKLSLRGNLSANLYILDEGGARFGNEKLKKEWFYGH